MPDAVGKKAQKNNRLLGFTFFQSFTDEEVDKDNYDPQIEILSVDSSGISLMIRIWIRRPAKSETAMTDMYISLTKRFKDEGVEIV